MSEDSWYHSHDRSIWNGVMRVKQSIYNGSLQSRSRQAPPNTPRVVITVITGSDLTNINLGTQIEDD
jgi:hypothetical protein